MAAALALVVSVGQPDPAAKVCTVHHSTEVRYRGFGYDHYVHISNACDETVTCEIRASSREGIIHATVPGRKRIAILVRRGSPSRKLTAAVYCKTAE